LSLRGETGWAGVPDAILERVANDGKMPYDMGCTEARTTKGVIAALR